MFARSKYMYAVARVDHVVDSRPFVSRSGKWTKDPDQRRWYAYLRYAMDKKNELEKQGIRAVIIKANRDFALCKAGGQKARL